MQSYTLCNLVSPADKNVNWASINVSADEASIQLQIHLLRCTTTAYITVFSIPGHKEGKVGPAWSSRDPGDPTRYISDHQSPEHERILVQVKYIPSWSLLESLGISWKSFGVSWKSVGSLLEFLRVCWSLLQSVGVFYSLLESLGVSWSFLGSLWSLLEYLRVSWSLLQSLGVFCSLLKFLGVSWSFLESLVVFYSLLESVGVF